MRHNFQGCLFFTFHQSGSRSPRRAAKISERGHMLTERSQLGAVAGWYISPESFQKGYDPGIDDYMVKPGDFSGLLMRVRALLRRANIEASRKLSVDGLLLYADALTASLAGAEIPVTIREFNILYELLSCPNRIFPLRVQAEVLWQRQTH